MRKTFVLHTDKFEAIKLLDQEQRGTLLTAIYAYSLDEELPEMDDMTKMLFTVIRSGLDETNRKYEEVCEKRRSAGRKRGRAMAEVDSQTRNVTADNEQMLANEANADDVKQTKQTKQMLANEANASKCKQMKQMLANAYDTETETDTETDTDTETETETDLSITGERDKVSAKPKPIAPVRHKYGEYKNVLLSDEELEKLKAEFPDWQRRIENLSAYLAQTGKVYKSHLATIRNWARRDQTVNAPPGISGSVHNSFHNFPQRQYSDDFFAELSRRNREALAAEAAGYEGAT